MDLPDFSRLNELFYPHLYAAVKRPSVQEFIGEALREGYRRKRKCTPVPSLRAMYSGRDATFSCDLFPSYDHYDINAIEFTGVGSPREALLSHLHGQFTAEYIPSDAHALTALFKHEDYKQTTFEFVFAPTQSRETHKKQIVLVRGERLQGRATSFLVQSLFQYATRLAIHADRYVHDDSREALLQERSELVRTPSGDRASYQISTPTDQALPVSILPEISAIFSWFLPSFTSQSFETIRFTLLGEKGVS